LRSRRVKEFKMKRLIFRQLFDQETWTYTYLLADAKTKEGIIIDPVFEKFERDLRVIRELGIKLKYTLETHTHADHITGASKIKEATGAETVNGLNAGAECSDIKLDDGDTLNFGMYELKALSTPGHTDGCMSYYVAGMVFTGDALFIRGTGRTDFQQGSPEKLYESINEKIYALPDDTLIYPGHDYKGETVSSIKEEKLFNPRIALGTKLEDFVATMNNLNLANPKKIHEAVPANLKCGKV
jgi:sulfur dioxygenase